MKKSSAMTKAIMMTTVYFIDAWYVVDAKTMEIVIGPFETNEDAIEHMKSRAWRINQGWEP